jgi:sialidase-1
MIEYLEGHIVYENPKPHVHSRHGYFPGMVKLSSGELLTLFSMAEAFEAPNATTYVTRSRDSGKTWELQGPIFDLTKQATPATDYLKPTILSDGTLVAIGYRFHRNDPEQGIAIEATGGFQPGDNILSFSKEDGRTWTAPAVIERSNPELIEISGPAVATQSGDLLALGALLPLPDGTNPSGPLGVLLRSQDRGRSWKQETQYFKQTKVIPYESRLCEMQPGRLVVIVWAYDLANDKHLPNHVTVSHDNGKSWSAPIDTGHMGQSSSLFWLGDDLLLSCHAHRGSDAGLYVRVVNFKGDRWKPIGEKVVWGASIGKQTSDGQAMNQMFTSLRFGQPSLVSLGANEFLLTHWSIEDGQGKIRAHRLRITL